MTLALLHAGPGTNGPVPTLDLKFAQNLSLTGKGPTPSFSRASTGTFFNSAGVLTTAAINAPRFDHTYDGTSWVSKGLLVEEQRTNYVKYANDLSTNWTNESGATREYNSIASPDGSSNATKVNVAAIIFSGIYQFPLTNGGSGIYTYSIFAKKGTKDWLWVLNATGSGNSGAFFNISNGTLGTIYAGYSASIFNCGNGWYRCILTTTTATPTFFQFGFSDSNSSYVPATTGYSYVYGAQIELGSFPTSYIGTTSSSVTRSADVCQITGGDFYSFWNGTEGSVFAEYDTYVPSSNTTYNTRVVAVSDAATNLHRIFLSPNASVSPSGWQAFEVRHEPSGEYSSLAKTPFIGNGTTVKIAAAYKVNDLAASFNGESALTDTSQAIPTGCNIMRLGNNPASTNYLCGHIARLRYYPKRLPNATLQLLSDPNPNLELQFARDLSLTSVKGPTPSYSRASTATYFNASGILTSAAVNAPRFDHAYNGSAWVSKGLLIEEQRTNLLPRSEEFNTGWTNNDINISANSVTAPDGTLTADNLVPNTTNTNHRLYQGPAGSGVASVSIFAKSTGYGWLQVRVGAGGGTSVTVNFDIINGAIGSTVLAGGANASGQSIENCGNGWWRCKFTTSSVPVFTTVIMPRPDNAVAEGQAYAGDGVKGVAVWGAQLETGSFSTSYIPTTSASVTRSADVCQITGSDFAGFWNASEGSVVFEAGTFSDSSYLGRYLEFTQISSGFSKTIGTATVNSAGSAGGDNVYNSIWDSGFQAQLFASPARPSAKNSFAWKANDFAASINGATALTDASGTIPTGIDILTIGSRYGSLNIINGHIAKLIYYPARLTNTKLQQFST